MPTSQDIIGAALRLIGVLAAGETLGGSEANDGRQALNDLVESLSNERLTIFEISRDTHTLTANTNPHTIGTSGSPNINTARPLRIERAGLIESGQSIEYPVEIVTEQRYGSIADKTTTSTIPQLLWYEPEFPNAKIHLWPVVSAAQTLVLYTWAALSTFSDLTTDVTFPPGYARLLKYNLARELAPEYGREPSQTLLDIAAEAKGNVKRLNAPVVEVQCDPALTSDMGSWDYRTGDYRQ